MVGLRAPWGTEGGVETVVGKLAPLLVQRGCEVTVYCRRRYNSLGPGIHQGVHLRDVGTVYSRSLEALVHTGLATPRATVRADLVHIHAMGPALWSWVPRLGGRATVVSIHGMDWQRDKWGRSARLALQAGEWSATRFAHRIITVGQHLDDNLQRRHGRQSTVIPNGVDPIPSLPLVESGIEGLVSRKFVLFLGRLVPEKGLNRLIESWNRVQPEIPLLIVGGSTHMDAYESELHAMAGPGIRFTGPLFGSERDALLSHARALVLPSHLEGFPLVPLEAMSAGTPVWLSDIPPHHEVLREAVGAAGEIVTDGEWDAAIRRISALSQSQIETMGERGRAHVHNNFSWDVIADRTMDLYRSAIRDRTEVE